MIDDDWDDQYNFSCHSVGMSGECGEDCPVFLRGDCENADELITSIIKEINDSESEMKLESYDEVIQEMVEDYLDKNVEVKQKNIITSFNRAMEILK